MDIRYHSGQPVRLKLLDSDERLEGRIVQLAGRAAVLELTRSLKLDTPIRVDLDDCMLLGEVSACEFGSGQYLVRIKVGDAVPVMSDLARLITAVMSDGVQLKPQQEYTRSKSLVMKNKASQERKVVLADHLS